MADELLEIKAGARHSQSDMDHIQSIHDHSVDCGADCGYEEVDDEDDGEDEGDLEDAGKAIKGIMDNPSWYAQHECGDIMQASAALNTMTMLIQSELMEEDEDDAHIALLCDGARTLVKFISDEIDELEGAAGDAADTARMGPMNKALTIEDMAALIDSHDDGKPIHGSEIKAIDDETVRGYVVLFGDKDHSDLQRDYFTKATDFWLDHFGWPRPITYHHGMDAATRADPIIGHWMKAGVDNVGLWLEGQLDRAHAYYKAMRELARRGYLKPSTDSAPQWVLREQQDNGTNFVKRWPMISSSLTVTPMEPRMYPVEVKAYLAELGMDIDDSPEAINHDLARSDATKASDDERLRRLRLELELLELETV